MKETIGEYARFAFRCRALENMAANAQVPAIPTATKVYHEYRKKVTMDHSQFVGMSGGTYARVERSSQLAKIGKYCQER